MNNQTINPVVWSEQLSEPLRQALAQEIQRLAGEIVVAREPLIAALTAANAAMLEAIRSALPPSGPGFPGLDVKELGKLFFKRAIEQRRMIEDEKIEPAN